MISQKNSQMIKGKSPKKGELKDQQELKFLSHGMLGDEKGWKQPKLVAKSQQISRPGYSNIKANEYLDASEVLAEKVKILTEIIKKSENLVIYSGAGISRAAGIADYASKAKNTKSQSQNHSLNRLQARPTEAHYIITEMEKKKYVQQWIQQNHDGLAQKSGFPLTKLNEIHGSWFDKKNPVVMMDDCLKPKNFNQLIEWQEKVDICLALGTSLCGMRSDGVAASSAKKGGLVIINLQETPYDSRSCLRIYGNLQDVMKMLAKELKITVKERICIDNPYQWVK